SILAVFGHSLSDFGLIARARRARAEICRAAPTPPRGERSSAHAPKDLSAVSEPDHAFGRFARIEPEQAHVFVVPRGEGALDVSPVDSNKKPHVSRRNDSRRHMVRMSRILRTHDPGRWLAAIVRGGDDDELARFEHVSVDRRRCTRSHRRPRARSEAATTQAGWCALLAGSDSLRGLRAADPVARHRSLYRLLRRARAEPPIGADRPRSRLVCPCLGERSML